MSGHGKKSSHSPNSCSKILDHQHDRIKLGFKSTGTFLVLLRYIPQLITSFTIWRLPYSTLWGVYCPLPCLTVNFLRIVTTRLLTFGTQKNAIYQKGNWWNRTTFKFSLYLAIKKLNEVQPWSWTMKNIENF